MAFPHGRRERREAEISSQPSQKLSGVQVRHHFGVYGIHTDQRRVLAVRKSRGPYLGQLDLTGGTPEANETWADTLIRELREETGAAVVWYGPWERFEVRVSESSRGDAIDFRHTAVWCEVNLEGIDFDLPAYEDAAGLAWVPLDDWRDRDDLSIPLRDVLRQLGDVT